MASICEVPPVTLLQVVIIALLQGITEFLPISSSGHLILVPELTDWPDQGLVIDVAVHVGTLFAVMIYFWRDVLSLTLGAYDLARGRVQERGRRLLYLIAATLPVAVAGYLLNRYNLTGYLRSMEIIAWTTLGFGILLYIADRIGMTLKRVEHIKLLDAMIIGFAQVLALVPGTSRSGITMTAARTLGFERGEAARFSMLLSIPAILGAGILKGRDLYESGDLVLGAVATLAAGFAFVTALAAIAVLMRWLRRSSFTPFVLYRLALGGGLLFWIYS